MKNIESVLLHSDLSEKDTYNAHITPIYNSSTYILPKAEQAEKIFSNQQSTEHFLYNRFGTPTIASVENMIVEIEKFGLEKPSELKAIIHSSGMGAISNLFFSLLKPKDEILTHYSVYGGTQELMDNILLSHHIKTHCIDFADLNNVEDYIKTNPNIKLLYLESPSNPLMQCHDIKALSELSKKYNKKIAIDNSFSTPYIQQAFKYGVDFVVYSTTKFLNGHGNLIGGALVGKDIDFMQRVAYKHFKLLGACPSSYDAFLLSNGMRTLHLRMERHSHNALELATFLEKHKNIERVNYCGLPANSSYSLAKKQMKMFGGMLSFYINGSKKDTFKVLNRFSMCKHAVSLGTFDTIFVHPATSSHIGLKEQDKKRFGITDNLIRVSVGLENIEDIKEDFAKAIDIH